MSEQRPPAPVPPPWDWNRAILMAFLLLLGGAMLLPGLCALFAVAGMSRQIFADGGLVLLWLASLMIGIGGIVLLTRARRLSGHTGRRPHGTRQGPPDVAGR
jgi:hypothetical protein